MDKDFILAEIKRTAEQNGGAPLGQRKFAKITGIKTTDWYGRYWIRWSDALAEAGYAPNEFQVAYEERELLEFLAVLVRELGHFPVFGELRIKARHDETFPSDSSFAKLGSKDERIRKVLEYCTATSGFEDVASICRPLVTDEKKEASQKPRGDAEAQFGHVYLARMGKYYKIGHTGSVGRRQYEIALQLPEKLTLVHSISTDDPAGIEAYWHKRFEQKRANGEWFELSAQDVRAFKRRTFM